MTDFRQELSVDLYELTMGQVYWRRGMSDRATFSLYFRGYPKDRGYYVACGIDDALDFLENFRFDSREIDALHSVTSLSESFVRALENMRFTGDVRAVPDGTIVFADEPVIEVTAPILEAQIVETMLLNIVTTASLMATKASRVVHAAVGRPVVDFGARRAHGEDAAIAAARWGYAAGFAGTSLVKASARYAVPAVGTMAHSFVQSFETEATAFSAYADEFPRDSTLLVDTYDTIHGIKSAVDVAMQNQKRGMALDAIRIDSGDLAALSKTARQLLDEAGLTAVRIIVSGGLDEMSIDRLVRDDAPIDAFGVGTRFVTSADAPYIDSAYKLVEFNGRPVFKRSPSKYSLPWAKQVYRRYEDDNMVGDLLTKADAKVADEGFTPLLLFAMTDGERLKTSDDIETVRERVAKGLASLPRNHRQLRDPDRYPVKIDATLKT